MKTIILTFALVLTGLVSLWAQPNPNDLLITGYILDANGDAVDGQYVCATYTSGTNPAIADSSCGYTNANGWYSITVINGSVIGQNQSFDVGIWEYCQNSQNVISQTIQNQQGMLDTVSVILALTCGSNSGCNCVVDIVESADPNGIYTFATNSNCTATSYQWSMPDGSNSPNPSNSYQFLQDGTYGICVTTVDANGCTASACDTIVIGGSLTCDAYFYYESTPNGAIVSGENTQFTYSGQGQNMSTYNWTVQGGGMILLGSDSMNPNLLFPNAGTYNVCLTVEDGQGCSDTFCADVYVVDGNNGGDSCTASFVYSVIPLDSGLIVFSAYGANNSNQYVWDFGDGSSGSGSSPTHQYNANQSWYWACLTVYGPNGCQESFCDTISLDGFIGGGCNAGFSNSGNTPIGYTFTSYAQDPNASYDWSIDGVANQADGASLYVPGFVDGVHTVCLTVNTSNCTDTQCMTIYVSQDSCFGWISGQVFAGNLNQPIDVAQVYLISFDANTNQLTEVQSAMVDSGGYYYFSGIPCGEYLVKAATTPNSAFFSSQLPTYYGNSTFWNYGQTIVVTEVAPAVQYDITLITGNNPGGPGFIGGDVTEGANKMAAEGDPIEGVTVMLFDMAGNAIAYTYTDAYGAFGFDNLAYGMYQVYTELINFTTVPAVVAIGEDDPSVDDIHVFVADEFISTGVEEVNFDALVSGVYPSPMADNGSLTVNFEQNYTVTMSIVDLTGRVITSESRVLPAGKSTMAVAAAGLSEGYYMLIMTEQAGAFSITRKFAVAH